MAFVTPLLVLLAAYVGFRLLQFALLVLSFARARLQAFRVTRCEREQLPQQVLPLFDAAAELLAARGFELAGYASTGPAFFGDTTTTPCLALVHPVRRTWAWLTPASNPAPATPLELSLTTCFAAGDTQLTLSGRKADRFFESPEERVSDVYRVRMSEQIDDHFALIAQRADEAIALDLDQLIAHSNETIERSLGAHFIRASDGSHRLDVRRVLERARCARASLAALQKLWRARTGATPEYEVPSESLHWVDARAFALMQRLREFPAPRWFVLSTLGLTMALFAASVPFIDASWSVLQTVLVLLVHELGHYLAMRATGAHQPTVFFVPFLGAATVGRRDKTTFSGELLMLGAGPLPGLLLGACALLFFPDLPHEWRELAKLSVWINGANMLPLWPLDGGKILQLFLGQERPLVEALLGALSTLAFAVVALMAQDMGLGAIAYVTMLGALGNYRTAQAVRRARAYTEEPSALHQALRATASPPLALPQRLGLVWRVVERLSHDHGPRWQRAVSSVGYVCALGLTLAAFGLTSDPEEKAMVLQCTDMARLEPISPSASSALVRCRSHDRVALRRLERELGELVELPPELSLRGPAPADSAHFERERAARLLVGALESAWREAVTEPADELEERPAVELATLEKRGLEVLAARVAELRRQPGFDEATAAAYLEYRQAASAAAARRLEALLGRAESEQKALRVFYAAVNKDDTLTTYMRGDVSDFARHACARGCSTLELRGMFTPR